MERPHNCAIWCSSGGFRQVRALYGYYADCHSAGWNYHGNLAGQSLSIDVRLTSGWAKGYLELLIESTYHEAWGGRPAGDYSLSYRFVPPAGVAGRIANGDQGVITVPVTPAAGSQWRTVTITPAADIAALWPDQDYRDFALWGLTLGADLLEVGYKLRGGCDLAHHVALWDIMSRNAIFLTGNGTSDDHFGQDWFGMGNNWFTSAWAKSTGEADLLTALAAGRAWCASLSGYRGSLDLLVDGSVPMGSASVSTVRSRKLAATATAMLPAGSLQILRGTVDYAGTAVLAANTKVIGSYTAAQLAGGSVTQWIDTTKDRFVRTRVLDSTGTVVGLSNPVWLLRSAPPGGIPAPRRA
jgi:hypothetical protein